jgi:hypothetical protein
MNRDVMPRSGHPQGVPLRDTASPWANGYGPSSVEEAESDGDVPYAEFVRCPLGPEPGTSA